MTTNNSAPDLVKILFKILFFAALILGSFWVLRPFLSALAWAVMIVISTWPLMLRVKALVRESSSLAVFLMVLILCVLVFVPVWLVIKTIVENSDTLGSWANIITQFKIPQAPAWLASIPLVGDKLMGTWQHLADLEQKDLTNQITPYLVNFIRLLPAQLGSAGTLFIHFLLTIIISVILYLQGEGAATAVRAFARRLANDRGDQAILLAAHAIRAVAMGIVVTALVQAAVTWVGFLIAGIPYAILLTAIIFVLSVVQIGALPVLAPTVIWLYWSGDAAWGTFMLVWSVFVMGIDNFLRPCLIRKGANLPLLLIFAGVIGGLISFGIIGLFLGPVILAVTYTLTNAWIEETV